MYHQDIQLKKEINIILMLIIEMCIVLDFMSLEIFNKNIILFLIFVILYVYCYLYF